MLHGKDYDPDKFSLYFQAMILLYGDKLEDLDADFLDKEFIKRHKEIWVRMKNKYQFTNTDVNFEEAVYYAKAVLKEQILRIRHGQYTQEAKSLVRNKKH
jgi:hypothetical protein